MTLLLLLLATAGRTLRCAWSAWHVRDVLLHRVQPHRTGCVGTICKRWYAAHGLRIVLLALLMGSTGLTQAQAVLPVPALTARVIDQTNTLGAADKAALEARLAAYEHSKGSQIVVLMVSTTQPEDIASYAWRVASTWKIGRRDVGDGVLVVVAKDDRRMRIEVAKKLEGALPDLAVARILDQAMKPQFRTGHYAAGLAAAVDAITQALDGEALPAVQTHSTGAGSGATEDEVDWLLVLILVSMGSMIVGDLLKARMGRGLGSLATGTITGGLVFGVSGLVLVGAVAGVVSLLLTLFAGLGGSRALGNMGNRMSRRHAPIVIGSPPFGGGSDWGSGGFSGGFGSGGGGDFGGGGASGDW